MRNPIVLLALLCAACSSTTASLPTIRPYHMDIQQGNVVTSKMMMQLKPGMTKSQVRFVMGTPLITDSFHADRWDYFYSMQKDGRLIEQRRVILEFEKDALKRVRGDVIPAGSAGAAASGQDKTNIPPTSIWENKPDAPQEEKKGLLDQLKFWGDDKKPEQKPQPMPEPEIAPAPKKTAPPEPKQEAQPAPVPEPKAEPESKPEPMPVAKEKAADTPQKEEKGLLDRLKFWGDDEETPKPEPKAEPMVKPTVEPAAKPVPKPAPAKVEEAVPQTPLAKRPVVAEPVEPKPVPKPAELPSEEDPTYFERMLEKIGF